MATWTNEGLVRYVEAQLGKPYWFGTYGCIASKELEEQKRRDYPRYYTATDFSSQYGQKVHDCSGLAYKGYLMTPDADKYPNAPAVYNSKYDISANAIYEKAKEKGEIGTMPEIRGLLVWKNNHIGVYVGEGWVVEAKSHADGVVRTRLKDRPWQCWLKHPEIDYIKPAPEPPHDMCTVRDMPVLVYGDKMNEVSLLQLLLNELGYRGEDGKELKIDKDFGRNTYKAVCDLQKKVYPTCGEPDGVVGSRTWSYLFSARYT